MDEWLNIVIRQLILYSLPVLVSLTLVVLFEARLSKKAVPRPFFAITWRGAWAPLLASIALHRGIIIAMPNRISGGVRAAALQLIAHSLLCLLGFLLFSWSLQHQPPAGLPPLHHWWAKVLMFFNLCMACLHLLPLPGLLLGELLQHTRAGQWIACLFSPRHYWLMISLLAASPLLDWLLGSQVVFPVYEVLSSRASTLF